MTKIDSSSGATFFRVTPNNVDASSAGGFNEPPTIDFDNSDDGEDDDAEENIATTNVAN